MRTAPARLHRPEGCTSEGVPQVQAGTGFVHRGGPQVRRVRELLHAPESPVAASAPAQSVLRVVTPPVVDSTGEHLAESLGLGPRPMGAVPAATGKERIELRDAAVEASAPF